MASITTQGITIKILSYYSYLIFEFFPTGLCELFKTCRNLKKLSLEHCVMDEQSCQLLSKNRDLEVLNMSMCYGIGAAEIRWIVEGCKKLDSWNLAWTELPTDALELICSSSPRSLKRINISGCRERLLDERMY